MDIFWNSGEREKVQGLDFLNVRSIDQAMEKQWVAGITTISPRARYLSLLPWALSLYYERELKAQTSVQYDYQHLRHFLSRLEVIILAASSLTKPGESIPKTTSILGRDTHKNLLLQLQDSGYVELEPNGGGAIARTYVRPCQGFDILESGAPIKLLERGRKLYDAKQRLLAGCPFIDNLFTGGKVTAEDILTWRDHFSITGLLSAAGTEEKNLLVSFFLTSQNPQNEPHYQRFRGTLKWILMRARENPSSPGDLIAEEYSQCLGNGLNANLEAVRVAWVNYELRRRGHWGLELLLSAFSNTLKTLVTANLDEIISEWVDEDEIPEYLRSAIAIHNTPWELSWKEFLASIPENLLLHKTPSTGESRSSRPHIQAFLGFLLVVSCWCHSQPWRENKLLRTFEKGPLDFAFEILDQAGGKSIVEVLSQLVGDCAVTPHLQTTWRKMGNGQKCSLRFFWDGEAFRSTGTITMPGFSGERLGNVMRMLADLGLLTSPQNGKYTTTEAGHAVLAELEKIG